MRSFQINSRTHAVKWSQYIRAYPNVAHGAVCFIGTRIPVSVVLNDLAADETHDRILQQYPTLKPEHISAAVAYAADLGRESTDEVRRRVSMKPAEVAASYDQIADRWNRLEQSGNGIPQHERAIAFLDQRRYALDIGCGSSGRFVSLFMRYSFRVEGVDISEQMIALARQRHPDLTFYRADICQWELPRQYDLISAWDSVWHVPLEDQRAVLKKMMEGLAPGGVLIFTTPGLDVPSEKVDAAMGPEMYYSGLGIPETLALVAEAGCVCRHLEYDQHPELHLYLVVQRA